MGALPLIIALSDSYSFPEKGPNACRVCPSKPPVELMLTSRAYVRGFGPLSLKEVVERGELPFQPFSGKVGVAVYASQPTGFGVGFSAYSFGGRNEASLHMKGSFYAKLNPTLEVEVGSFINYHYSIASSGGVVREESQGAVVAISHYRFPFGFSAEYNIDVEGRTEYPLKVEAFVENGRSYIHATANLNNPKDGKIDRGHGRVEVGTYLWNVLKAYAGLESRFALSAISPTTPFAGIAVRVKKNGNVFILAGEVGFEKSDKGVQPSSAGFELSVGW